MRLSTVELQPEPTTTEPTEWAEQWFLGPDVEIYGAGVAARLELPAPWTDHIARVSDALAEMRIGRVNEPGVGPVALASLPFDRRGPATFTVCHTTETVHRDGRRWRTAPDPHVTPAARTPPTPPSPDAAVHALTDPSRWSDAVGEATERIAAGSFHKVVLARAVDVEADRPWDPPTVAAALAERHPHALRWCIDSHVGASPELLIARSGDVVRAQPMAGTTPRTGSADDAVLAAELLASEKNRAEHQITIDMVHEAVLGWCSYLDSEPEPRVVPAGSVQHLATLVEGRLSAPQPSVLELVAALHPTPAVGGWPTDAALDAIAHLEQVPRGRYAGPVGWVDANGNGTWAVGIRGAELHGTTARLFAGVGVVAESDPAAELRETRDKLAATLPLLTTTSEPADT